MSSAALTLSQSATVGLETLAMADAHRHRAQAQESGVSENLAQLSEANRMSIVSLNLIELFASYAGVDSSTLKIIKGIELLPRSAACYIEFQKYASAPALVGNSPGRMISQSVVVPLIDLVKCGMTYSMYQELSNVDALGRGEVVMRRIYAEDDLDGYRPNVGYRETDLQETRGLVDQRETQINYALGARLIADDPIRTWAIKQGESLYAAVVRGLAHIHEGSSDRLVVDLIGQDRILPIFHDDEIFRQYICPITSEPIRFPVSENGRNQVYERRVAIEAFGEGNLRERPAIAAIINSRVRYHQSHLMEFLQNYQPQSPVDRSSDGYDIV
jgi:hypothetical protein